MTFNTQQQKSLSAFITALGQQEDALPQGLQAQLHAIGLNLENRVTELPAIAASLPGLNQSYQKALADARDHEDTPGATLVSSGRKSSSRNGNYVDELSDRATEILTDSDPVAAAKQKMSPLFGKDFGKVATNPIRQFFRRG